MARANAEAVLIVQQIKKLLHIAVQQLFVYCAFAFCSQILPISNALYRPILVV